MTIAVDADVGSLVAAAAVEYIGTPSVPHSRFHTGIMLPERQEPKLAIDPNAEEKLFAGYSSKGLKDYKMHKYEYHRQHSAETGLDCSGHSNLAVLDVFKRLGGVADVPRHVKGFYIWAFTDFVPTNSLRCGDFIFFQRKRSTHRAPPDHMGIYVGNNALIHSNGGEGCKVEKASLESIGSLVAAKRLMI